MKAPLNDLMEKIFSLSKHGIKLGLENMNSAIKALDLNINKIRFVHIAGTNGKGSTAVTLYSLIKYHSNGKKTALYTSPHLTKFNERILVDGKQISDQQMLHIADIIFTKCKDILLTFFEFTTLMALHHFVDNNVDTAIMEVGLGGRLDATNIIDPEVAIITSIGYDHTEYLGRTLKEIASEKAGIFKKGTTVIMAKTSCNETLIQTADSVQVKDIYEIGRNVNYVINSDDTFDVLINNEPLYKNIRKKLLGEHQYSNSCLALLAFNKLGIQGTPESINQALSDVSWPGRLEPLLIKGKQIYVDVSHNVEGIQKTIEFITATHKKQPIYTACGFMNDKDYTTMIDLLSKISKKLFLIPTTVTGRELGIKEYKNSILDRQTTNILICNDFNDAVNRMMKEDGLLLFTGSIYNYEHIYKILQEVE